MKLVLLLAIFTQSLLFANGQSGLDAQLSTGDYESLITVLNMNDGSESAEFFAEEYCVRGGSVEEGNCESCFLHCWRMGSRHHSCQEGAQRCKFMGALCRCFINWPDQ